MATRRVEGVGFRVGWGPEVTRMDRRDASEGGEGERGSGGSGGWK